jgi:hypothetical protein
MQQSEMPRQQTRDTVAEEMLQRLWALALLAEGAGSEPGLLSEAAYAQLELRVAKAIAGGDSSGQARAALSDHRHNGGAN